MWSVNKKVKEILYAIDILKDTEMQTNLEFMNAKDLKYLTLFLLENLPQHLQKFDTKERKVALLDSLQKELSELDNDINYEQMGVKDIRESTEHWAERQDYYVTEGEIKCITNFMCKNE